MSSDVSFKLHPMSEVFAMEESRLKIPLLFAADGTVVAWGDNRMGQASVPRGLIGVVAVSAAQDHTLALLDTGRVVAHAQTVYMVAPRFTVSDEGPGIPEEWREKVFQPYARRDTKTARGSGIGLYAAKRLAESMNGRVWCEPAGPAGGARFVVALPVAGSAIATGTFPILPATIADRLLALKLNWDGHESA